MLDALADDLADIVGVEGVGDLYPLGAQLAEFLIDRAKTRANPFMLLKILAAGEDIVVDLLDAFAQAPAFLAEGLA